MHPVIKSQTRMFQQEQSLSRLTDSEAFEAYTIYSVIAGLLSYSVDPLSVHLRGDEFGLDGLAILIQGKLATDSDEAETLLEDINDPDVEFIFFQSKTGSSYDYGDISKFFDGIEAFFNDHLYGESPQLDDLIAVKDVIYSKAVKKRNPSLRIYYASTGTYKRPPRIEALVSQRVGNLKDLSIFANDSIVVEMLGAEKLQAYYRSATRATQATIEFSRQVPLPKNDRVEQGYVGFISANELVKLVDLTDENGDSLGINRFVFFDNVRDYNEKSPLNISVGKTLEENAGRDFVFRNNGVTVIAKSIHRTADDFRIEDYQIVNGCQTTNILYQHRDKLADVSVPFRLIGSSDDDFTASIIIGTNSQNQIKEEQFLALRPFVKDLEEYANSVEEHLRIYIERREHQYHRESIERARIMPLAVLMKAASATLLKQPNKSARDYKRLFKENANSLFNERSDVQIYHAIAYIYYRLEFLWRNQRIDNSLKIFRFYLLWAAVEEVTGSKNLLSLNKPAQCEVYARKIIELAEDEDRFKSAVIRNGLVLEQALKNLASENREKLRDSIRSDTFFGNVKEQLFPVSPEATQGLDVLADGSEARLHVLPR